MLCIIVVCCLAPVAIIMPIALKHSPQVGFLAFGISCLLIGFLCGMASGYLDALFEENVDYWYNGGRGSFIILGSVALISVILYIISWFCSIKIYEKADL